MIASHTRLTLARAVLAVWVAIVLWSSLAPAAYVPGIESASDKVFHAVAYVGLGLLSALALPRVHPGLLLLAVSSFGLLIEVLQFFTGYRSFEWQDVLADVVGAGLGIGLGIVVIRRMRWQDHR